MAQDGSEPPALPEGLALPAWKSWTGVICAVGLALMFLVAGVWKLSDPLATSARMVQALIPAKLATATALATGSAELWVGVLLLVPRWRRWGAGLSMLMLFAFMVYMGVNYTALQGEDCSCFPWLKRVVGPGFFISDGAMLLMAMAAGWWARPSENWRTALVPLAAIAVFAGAVYGVTVARQTGLKAPESVIVDGKPYSLEHGRVFLYFFDPQCAHCYQAAKALGQHRWTGVKAIAVATVNPQWGQDFLNDTKFDALLSSDVAKLRQVFSFTDPPYGVALEHGRQVQAFPVFEGETPASKLKKLGWIE